MLAPAPNRRRLAFSLRTLLIAVTLISGWLGYEWNWIRQRRQLLATFQLQVQRAPLSTAAYRAMRLRARQVNSPAPWKPRGPRFVLWLFREAEVSQLDLTFNETDAWLRDGGNVVDDLMESVRRLFPETQLNVTLLQPIEAEIQGPTWPPTPK